MRTFIATAILLVLVSTAAFAQGGDFAGERRAATLPAGVETARFAFSPDGATVAYAVEKPGGGVDVYRGDERLGTFEAVHSLTFAPDGKALAFAAREEGKTLVVLGRDRFGPHAAVQEGSLVVSPFGSRVAYVALTPTPVVCVDGERLVEAQKIGTLRWSRGGTALGFGVRVGAELWWKTVEVPRKPGEISPPERYKAVLMKYYMLNFECVKGQREFNSDEAWDEAARSAGFEDKRAFDAWVAQIADPSLARAAQEAAQEYQRIIRAWSEEQMRKAAGGGGGEKEGGDGALDHVIHQPNEAYPNDDVIVWKDPGRNSRAFVLAPGTRVAVLEKVDGEEFGSAHVMMRIRTDDGREGWIPKIYVRKAGD